MNHSATRERFALRLAPLLRQATIAAGVAAAVLIAGMFVAPERAWVSLWMGSFLLICLGLAGLFFVALQYASGAVWSIVLRRVGEAMSSALPAGAVGILLVLIAHPSLFPWYHHPVHTEGWAAFKHAWLSYPFFFARALIYIAVWLGFGWAIRRNSNRQDNESGPELSRRNTRLSVIFMVAFAFTFWLASTDWVMTLEPHWSSTIFGIYNFSGMFVAGVAALALVTIALRNVGPLRGTVTGAHFLDLGRLLVAFSTFWMYIWFSQYMLIWYTNFNEETAYMLLRSSHGWGKLFVLNVILNWGVPFLLLLPRANKKNPHTLAAGAVILLAGRIVDVYLLIAAPFSPQSPVPSVWDFAALVLVAGVFITLTFRTFFSSEPVPLGDPLLPESVHSHA
ncbi:MAG: hypothetical protein HYX72_02495 [Acidobacteria bacterium]|nr:hypothetical protein [Acidobacteriota bacterium]